MRKIAEIRKGKNIVDLLMVTTLLLLMPYELIGEKAHELLGICMFVLVAIHQILNRQWYRGLGKGRYSFNRLLSTAVNGLLVIVMVALPISGIAMAKHIVPFLRIDSGKSVARTIHLLLSHWGYVLMSIHIGLHWSIVVGMVRKAMKSVGLSRWLIWALRVFATAIAVYGIYALISRGFVQYMFLRSRFAFFDFDEPLYRFYADYLAVMGLFAYTGYYLLRLCKAK